MVNLGGQFDANSVQPNVAFDVIPPGWYAARITASETATTAKGGKLLKLTFEFDESRHPELKGRKVWARLNLWNDNPQASQIAQRDLSAICRSVGAMAISDTDALHHKPLALKLKVRAAEGQYEASNEPCGYDAIAARFPSVGGVAQPPVTPHAAAPAPTPSAPAPATAPPWARK